MYNATLIERVDLTDELVICKIAPDEPPAAHWFVPGQYCVLGMNDETRPEPRSVRRPMTIVSAPEAGGPLEFYIRYVPSPASETPLTHLLWPLSAGDRLYMRVHAAGAFTLRDTVGEEDARLRILVAAGTGVAPFISMLRSAVLRDPAADLSRYVLLHGASYPAHLGYGDELRALATRHGLRYLATVSRPQGTPAWTGDIGRVEEYLRPERIGALEERLGLAPGSVRPASAAVHVCGLRGTIGTCIRHLIGRGFIPDNRRIRRALEVPADAAASLFYEQYDSTPVLDVKDPAVVAPLREALAGALANP